jgi:O-antigen/teichoic acid export membrane protein
MILAYTILNSSQAIFIGWKMMNFVSISNVIHSILRLVIGPVLVLVGLGVLGALIGFIFSSMVTGVITLLMLFARKTHIRTTISNFFQDTKTMISYGFPTYVGGIVLGFATQYVTIILAAIASNSVVGYYQAASNFMVTISIISSAIYIALFPAFASLDGKQGDTVLAFKYAVKYASYIISPTIFLLIGAAEPLINIIYGHSYLSAVIYLQLLAFSYLPLVFGLTVIPSFLNGIGKTRLTMYQNFIGAISLVTLAPILSGFTDLRVQGLIYSILASNLIVVFSGLAILSRVLKASIEIKSIISILIASILSYLAIVALQQLNLPVLIMPFVDFFVFLLVYLTLLPIFRGIDNSDLDRLATVIEELGYVAKIAKFLFKYEKFVIMVWKKRIEH